MFPSHTAGGTVGETYIPAPVLCGWKRWSSSNGLMWVPPLPKSILSEDPTIDTIYSQVPQPTSEKCRGEVLCYRTQTFRSFLCNVFSSFWGVSKIKKLCKTKLLGIFFFLTPLSHHWCKFTFSFYLSGNRIPKLRLDKLLKNKYHWTIHFHWRIQWDGAHALKVYADYLFLSPQRILLRPTGSIPIFDW